MLKGKLVDKRKGKIRKSNGLKDEITRLNPRQSALTLSN